MKYRTATTTAAALAALALAGCSGTTTTAATAPVEEAPAMTTTDWRDEARTTAQAHFDNLTDQARAEGCAALRTFGITTPDAGVQFAEGLGSLETGLTDFGLDPTTVPDTREAARIGYEIWIAGCGL